MKLDFQRLAIELKETNRNNDQKQMTDDIGISRVISFIWNQYATKYIDFDSFSLEDAKYAFDAFYYLPSDDYEISVEDMEQIKRNPWSIYTLNEDTIANIFKLKSKVYVYEDDYI